jgi:hypothetical protein
MSCSHDGGLTREGGVSSRPERKAGEAVRKENTMNNDYNFLLGRSVSRTSLRRHQQRARLVVRLN